MADDGSGGRGRRPINSSEDSRLTMDVNGEEHSPLVVVLPVRSQEVKAPRYPNGDGLGGQGVGSSSDYVPLNSHISNNGAACESPSVGRLECPLGVSTGVTYFRVLLSERGTQMGSRWGILQTKDSIRKPGSMIRRQQK